MEKDDATGLNHTLWRKADNWSGRWTSPDPYGGSMSPGDPQSFNRYAYCDNDPVNHVDLAGLSLADIGVYQTDDARAAQAAQNHSDIEFRQSFGKKTGVTAPPITVGGSSTGKGGGDPHLTGHGSEKVAGGETSDSTWDDGADALSYGFSGQTNSRRQRPRRGSGRGRLPRAGSGGQLRPAIIPGAPTEARAVSAALAILRNGCYDESSFSPSVTPRNRYFANVENPGQFIQGWHPAFSTHNSGALESPILVSGEFEPSTGVERSFLPPGIKTFEFGFVLKYYPGEGMAVTPSTDSEMHWIGAIEFTLKNPDVNVNFARQFLNVAPRCSTH